MTDYLLPALPAELGESPLILIRWLQAPGAELLPGMPLLILANEQAELVLPAPLAGTLATVLQPEGQQIDRTMPLAHIASSADPPPALTPQPHSAIIAQAPQRATPLARTIASNYDVSLEALVGTGDQGRILAGDVRAYMALAGIESTTSASPALVVPSNSTTYSGPLPICSACMVFDAHAMLDVSQKRYRGMVINSLACLAAACSQALLRLPQASFFWSDQGLLRRKQPALRLVSAEKTSFVEYAHDLNLQGIVRRMNDPRASAEISYTFSICTRPSSLGLAAAAPDMAPALTLGPIEMQAVSATQQDQERIEMRPYAWLSFQYDARVLSLYQADRFLSVVIQQLERISMADV